MFLIGVKQKGVQQLKRESFIHLQEEKKEKNLTNLTCSTIGNNGMLVL